VTVLSVVFSSLIKLNVCFTKVVIGFFLPPNRCRLIAPLVTTDNSFQFDLLLKTRMSMKVMALRGFSVGSVP